MGIPFGKVLKVVKPEYVYLKLKPNNSIRNNGTHNIARSISSLYRTALEVVKREDAKVIKSLGKELIIGTQYSINPTGKPPTMIGEIGSSFFSFFLYSPLINSLNFIVFTRLILLVRAFFLKPTHTVLV